ncbi:glycosyltransferase family 4 protein [Bradyrhizobium sp. AUGA SZCCT0240]|uniref:glycosyltransferase family 4 protein n=1 Tax=Bradyrhizobium sp. AUGA SZCCT0240 TaxID=2807669 RepID=UPI001BAA9E29|nr:glycosyltransferase family 1 protein [Bradyrhizobium sp. AUGA SZCCT0240]MBR1257971.1 glycosyltransferase family 4 protein [Bradyrhizobium sp. AUGA SZCCT0240]
MSLGAPLRLAFTLIPRRLWAGGYNYQSNLFVALSRFHPGEFTPVVFAGACGEEADLAPIAAIPGVEIVQSSAFEDGAGLAAALALGLDWAAAAEFRTQSIDAVFEAARFFGWRLPYPAVAWFPDLQHRKFPELFPRAARWRREAGFRVQIASKRTIMLSSESALRDFRSYYPRAKNDVSMVRFATQPSLGHLSANPAEVIAQYRLPERYFYLPNQFYRHKNHQVVVDALTILKQRGVDVVVCASGSTEDPRGRGYFEHFMAEVRSRGLEKRFVHLGMIPQSHVYALLRACVALINPSRFEGWSTTVEEAKSFGVPLILSNLEVHREQTDGAARFFGADEPVTLADHLVRASQDSQASVVRNVVPHQEHRVATFAADFANTIHRAMQASPS